jgi:hypothetical protein
MRIDIKKAKNIPKGMAILNDLDNTMNNMNPAAKLKMAVRVPDWNIPQMTIAPIARKKIRSHFIFEVMAKIIKATPVEAA